MERLHQVVDRVQRRGLGPLAVFPGEGRRQRRQAGPAHLLEDALGVQRLDLRELAEHVRDLAVVVRVELLGELRVALGRLEFHGVGLGHEIGVCVLAAS